MLANYWNTVRYLKPRQVYGRLRPKRDASAKPLDVELRKQDCGWIPCISKPNAQTGPKRFNFLNQEREVKSWNDPDIPKLWLYNLHYFEHSNEALIARWVTENPPGTGNGWEPYPTSLRILNWIKWNLSGGPLSAAAVRSLAQQAESLFHNVEHHLGANHLFANAVALTAAGMFFDGSDARRWLACGLELLRRELAEQVLADGAHYERTPMYHALILESLLDIFNVSRVFRMRLDEERALWSKTCSVMLSWLNRMTHPDGRISFFNDSAFGIAPERSSLADYAAGLQIKPEPRENSRESGYVRLANENTMLLFDGGAIGPDYQPGHAHADTLSIELSHHHRRVLVNSGISTYERGAERLQQRRTAAHNTICVDGQDQSEVWSSFRVARRAKAFDLRTDGRTYVEAAHDGYGRLPDPIVHRRRVELNPSRLTITDRLEGYGSHRAELFFHFHPEAAPHIELDRKLEPRCVSTHWHPEFNVSIENKTIVGEWYGSCPVEFVSIVHLI